MCSNIEVGIKDFLENDPQHRATVFEWATKKKKKKNSIHIQILFSFHCLIQKSSHFASACGFLRVERIWQVRYYVHVE